MAKFCGNCGSPMEDTAKVCGNCGTPLEVGVGKASEFNYVDPEKAAKTKKTIKWFISGVFLVVVAAIIINVLSGFIGYKGTVRKIMNAYKKYDIETFVNMASRVHDSEKEPFVGLVSSDLDYYEDELGHSYKLSYKITDKYELSKQKKDVLYDQLSVYDDFDEELIQKVVVAQVEITAKSKSNSLKSAKEIYLSKESGSWRLLFFNQR